MKLISFLLVAPMVPLLAGAAIASGLFGGMVGVKNSPYEILVTT